MRGHWVSGTRKLNRHYQSSEGGDGGRYTLIGDLEHSLLGIQFTGEDDQYIYAGTFHDSDSRNIIVPPCFQMANIERDLSTPISIDDVHLKYGEWRNDYLDIRPWTFLGKKRQSSTDNADIDTKIWRYGKFKSIPQWIKSVPIDDEDFQWTWPPANKGNMWWCFYTKESVSPNVPLTDKLNQNGVYRPDRDQMIETGEWNNDVSAVYIDDDTNHKSFEEIYNGRTVNALIPVYEIIAIPYIEEMQHWIFNRWQAVIGTSEYVNPKMRIKNLPRGYRLVGNGDAAYEPMTARWDDNLPGNVYKHNGYINQSHMYMGYYNGASELGRFGYINEFITDTIYYPLYGIATDASLFPIVAGSVEIEGRGTVDMIYAMRVDHLEVETISPTEYVSGYRFKLGAYGVSWEGI